MWPSNTICDPPTQYVTLQHNMWPSNTKPGMSQYVTLQHKTRHVSICDPPAQNQACLNMWHSNTKPGMSQYVTLQHKTRHVLICDPPTQNQACLNMWPSKHKTRHVSISDPNAWFCAGGSHIQQWNRARLFKRSVVTNLALIYLGVIAFCEDHWLDDKIFWTSRPGARNRTAVVNSQSRLPLQFSKIISWWLSIEMTTVIHTCIFMEWRND
jgi:hypothetical protein